MDVREKLVELLDDIQVRGEDFSDYEIYGMRLPDTVSNEDVASHLIAHGVTVQECGHWISLTECANAGVYCSVCHKKVYKEDYAWCNRKNKLRSDYCPHCGAKMTPQPPKGE